MAGNLRRSPRTVKKPNVYQVPVQNKKPGRPYTKKTVNQTTPQRKLTATSTVQMIELLNFVLGQVRTCQKLGSDLERLNQDNENVEPTEDQLDQVRNLENQWKQEGISEELSKILSFQTVMITKGSNENRILRDNVQNFVGNFLTVCTEFIHSLGSDKYVDPKTETRKYASVWRKHTWTDMVREKYVPGEPIKPTKKPTKKPKKKPGRNPSWKSLPDVYDFDFDTDDSNETVEEIEMDEPDDTQINGGRHLPDSQDTVVFEQSQNDTIEEPRNSNDDDGGNGQDGRPDCVLVDALLDGIDVESNTVDTSSPRPGGTVSDDDVETQVGNLFKLTPSPKKRRNSNDSDSDSSTGSLPNKRIRKTISATSTTKPSTSPNSRPSTSTNSNNNSTPRSSWRSKRERRFRDNEKEADTVLGNVKYFNPGPGSITYIYTAMHVHNQVGHTIHVVEGVDGD